MGRGYITMNKVHEDDIFVFYLFENSIIERRYYEKSGDTSSKVERRTVYGYCKLNKYTAEFLINNEKTDPYFLEEENWIGAAHYVLLRHFKENKGYPKVTGYAS